MNLLEKLQLVKNVIHFPFLIVVYRTSPSEFIVPFDQYFESVKNSYSIGMRFKMRFEGEEAPEQRYCYMLTLLRMMYFHSTFESLDCFF